MTTNEKGNIGLGQAIAYFTMQKYTVSLPLNDCQWYDLIIEKDNIFQTVQVKYTSAKAPSGYYICGLETTSPGTKKTLYSVVDTPVNLLFCYCENGDMYLIPVKEIKTTSQITLYPSSPNVNFEKTLDTSLYYLIKKTKDKDKIQEKIDPIKRKYEIKAVSQYSLDGVFIKNFNNCIEAAKTIKPEIEDKKQIYNIATNIGRVAKGERATAYGFQWKYSI